MKFNQFRFLRNADSGAGGGSSSASASSASPAASGGTPGGGAASSGDGGGSPAGGGTPAPSGDSSQGIQASQGGQQQSEPAKIHLPNRFDPNWEAEFQKLSAEDQQAYFHGDERFVEGDLNADQGQQQQQTQAKPEINPDDPITPEIMDSLPANVKALVDQALALEERVTPFEKFLTPEFQEDLRVIMEDPRVMSIVNDMKNGKDSPDAWFEKSVNMDEIYKQLNDEFKIESMDFAVNPEESSKIFKNAMVKMAQTVARNVMIHGEMKAREAKEAARREGLKNSVYFDLAQNVEALKSKEDISSDKHPIHAFRQEIESALAGGEISWSYFEKNGKALFAAFAARNGMVPTPQKQYASMRERIIKQVDSQARQAAISSTTMKPGSQSAAPNVRHGIDATKYFSMSESERTNIINSAIEAKNRGDDSMLRDLQTLESTGKWPG